MYGCMDVCIDCIVCNLVLLGTDLLAEMLIRREVLLIQYDVGSRVDCGLWSMVGPWNKPTGQLGMDGWMIEWGGRKLCVGTSTSIQERASVNSAQMRGVCGGGGGRLEVGGWPVMAGGGRWSQIGGGQI